MTVHRLAPEELRRILPAGPAVEPQAHADHRLLRVLSSLGRDALASLMQEQRYRPGDVVFGEGAPGDAMYLIWAGRVAVVKGDFQSPTILGYRGPGEVVGEMALLEDAPRWASLVALEELRLLRVGRENFRQLLDSHPAIGASLMATLSARLRESDTARDAEMRAERQLAAQVSALQTEKEHLLELQRVRQETSDLIVHDLRNPLGTIGNVIQMLEMMLPAEVLEANQELLAIAISSCSRMQGLVDSLLDVARLEAGEAQLHMAPLDLAGLLQEAFDRQALTWKEGRIRGRCQLPANLPPVIGDAERLDRVMANLIDNAINYTPAGGQVTVAAEAGDDQVVVSVADTGMGIPPEERERIFERFAQLPGEKGKRRGFGLGLAFCRLAVEAHGGHIWVEPGEGGVGSRFVFTLPLSPAGPCAPVLRE
jgi:signal transduction histidine kinase